MKAPSSSLSGLAALTALLAVGVCAETSAQSVATVPVGAVTVTIAAGTGTTPKLTSVSIPLLMGTSITGAAKGKISSFTSGTITSAGAGWQAGQLSVAQTPYLIRIVSGAAMGRTFLVSTSSSNTSDTLSIDGVDAVDLTTIGLALNDGYELIAADTLGNFLTPADGVLAGPNAASSDNILINKNGVWSTYFYNNAVVPSRWSRVTLGTPDATNEIIRPDTVILYSRLANNTLVFTVTGTVPGVKRASPIKNSGLTFASNNWPTDMTLSGLQLNALSGWVSNTSSALADRVLILSNGVWKTYFHDGTNWRQVTLGNPIRDTDSVSSASGILIDRRGAATGQTVYSRDVPYTL